MCCGEINISAVFLFPEHATPKNCERRRKSYGIDAEIPRELRRVLRSLSHRMTRFSLSALVITETQLRLIAALAIIGLSSKPKNGIEHAGGDRDAEHVVDKRKEKILPDVAHRRPAQRRARTMPRRSPLTSVMPALSIATSVPVPIAMPTCACASAGASLMPSPAIATMRPSDCSRLTTVGFPSGSTSASTSIDAELLRDRRRGDAVVAGQHDDPDAVILQHLRCASAVDALIGSATPMSPAGRPSIATNMTVWPSWRCASAAAEAASMRNAERLHHALDCRAPLRGPSIRPLTPCPVTDLKSSAVVERQLALFARRRRSPRPADARCRARGWRRGAARRRR